MRCRVRLGPHSLVLSRVRVSKNSSLLSNVVPHLFPIRFDDFGANRLLPRSLFTRSPYSSDVNSRAANQLRQARAEVMGPRASQGALLLARGVPVSAHGRLALNCQRLRARATAAGTGRRPARGRGIGPQSQQLQPRRTAIAYRHPERGIRRRKRNSPHGTPR